MKKLFIIFTFLFGITLFAQNLTLSEVLAVRKMDLGDADEYLTKKGWSFLAAEDETDEGFASAIYAFDKNYYDDTANSFLRYIYSESGVVDTRIIIQLHSQSKLNTYINQIKAWGGKQIDSYIDNGKIVKVYLGTTMAYIITTSNQKNELGGTKPIYYITVLLNSDLLY